MSIGAFGFRVFTITGLAGCTFTSLYLISATGIKQNSYDFFGGSFGTTADLKLRSAPTSLAATLCGFTFCVAAPSNSARG
jgi:hypothetical protein